MKQEENKNTDNLSNKKNNGLFPDDLFNQLTEAELVKLEQDKNGNENRNKLSYKEVEALIPDYLLNRLTEAERAEFEIAIVDFPDLEIELQEGKNLFELIEQIDYKKIMNDKSQYLPDRVVARLERRNALHQQYTPNTRRLLGAAIFCVCLLGLLYFFMPKNTDIVDVQSVVSNVDKDKSIFSMLEKIMIYEEFQDLSYKDFFEKILNNDIYLDDNNSWNLFDSDVIDAIYTDLTGEILPNNISYFSNLNVDNDYNYLLFLNEINNIDEESFQILMENLSNGKN